MKKVYLTIIAILVIIIAILVCMVFNMKNEMNSALENELANNNVVSNQVSTDVLEYNGVKVESQPLVKVDFADNQILAIGHVQYEKYEEFAKTYFRSLMDFEEIESHDFRQPDNRVDGYGNRFVLIPKDDSVKITVYDCFLNDQNEIEKDNTLVKEANYPFEILDDYIEYTPSLIVEFESNGFTEEFQIMFSGENGHLVLDGCEAEVKDITLYDIEEDL